MFWPMELVSTSIGVASLTLIHRFHIFCVFLSHRALQIMEAEVWHVREYMAALEDDSCTPAAMTRYFDRLLTRLHVDVLAHGNVGKDEAASLAPAISSALSNPQLLPEEELPSRHALRLPLGGFDGGDGVVLDLEAATQEEKNSAVQV